MLDLLTFVASVGLQSDMQKVQEDRPEGASHVETTEANHTQDNVADAADVLSNACQAVENAVSSVASVLAAPAMPDLRVPAAAERK